ncbi:4'-phosphopantetheinyl transferase family protein [Streptomyces decoyicus]
MTGWLDLWLLRPPQTVAQEDAMAVYELDSHELARADLFRRAPDRLLYLSAHIALRRLLSGYLGVAPHEVSYAREPCPTCGGPHGRPVIATAAPHPHFSLSHSKGLALIGVAATPVGVDVERLPRRESVKLCLPHLHPAEQKEIRELRPYQRPPAFARIWARKEAYLKGIGTGLSRGASADYLGERTGPGSPPRPPGWEFLDIPLGADGTTHRAAAAIRETAVPSVTQRRLAADCLFTGALPPAPSVRAAAPPDARAHRDSPREGGTPC